MQSSPLHSFTRRHLAWLLWLMLLLPLAQTAASWHVLSHAASGQTGDDGAQAIGQERCDLCLTAAAVLGGVPQVTPCSLVLPCNTHQTTFFAPPGRILPAPERAYNSRAPPLFLH